MLQSMIGMTLIIGVFVSSSVGLKQLYKRYPVSVEAERKILHLIIGLCLLVLPWVFHSVWPAVFLISAVVLHPLLLRLVPATRKLFARPTEVSRKSFGGPLFGIAFLVLFVLAKHHRLYYLISGLTIVVADAVAAIVGKRFPWLRYPVWKGYKTMSGSLAFFAVATLSIFIPLLTVGGYAWHAIWWEGLVIALSVTVIEAISPLGMDNFFIPLSVFFLLELFLL